MRYERQTKLAPGHLLKLSCICILLFASSCGSGKKSSKTDSNDASGSKDIPTTLDSTICTDTTSGICTEWIASSDINGKILAAQCQGHSNQVLSENKKCPTEGATAVCQKTPQSFMSEMFITMSIYYYAPEFVDGTRSEGLCTIDRGIHKLLTSEK